MLLDSRSCISCGMQSQVALSDGIGPLLMEQYKIVTTKDATDPMASCIGSLPDGLKLTATNALQMVFVVHMPQLCKSK